MQVSPQTSTTYTFHVSGLGGNGQCQTSVMVNNNPPPPPPPPPPPSDHPTCTLTGEPPQITAGAQVTLSWTTHNATHVMFSGAQGGGVPPNGSFNVFPTVTTSYEIVASNDAGDSVTCIATVVVTNPSNKSRSTSPARGARSTYSISLQPFVSTTRCRRRSPPTRRICSRSSRRYSLRNGNRKTFRDTRTRPRRGRSGIAASNRYGRACGGSLAST